MLFEEFTQSVYDLADKLPQWSSGDYERKYHSAISSLFEELGELAGVCSKMRSRSKEYYIPTKDQSNFEIAREKFLDETCDALWVLVCSCYVLGCKGVVSTIPGRIEKNASNYNKLETKPKLEDLLYNVIYSVTYLTICDTDNIGDLETAFEDVIYDFASFVVALNEEYDISFTDIMVHNMNKLGKRYDKNGNRVD